MHPQMKTVNNIFCVKQIFLTPTNSLLILRPKSFNGCATSFFSFTFPAEDELEQVMLTITLLVVMNSAFELRNKNNCNIPGWLVVIESLMQSVPVSV